MISTYSPDGTKIVLNGERINGLAENFIEASQQEFTLSVHAGSDSINYLLGLLNQIVRVSVKPEISLPDSSMNNLFDITGRYKLEGYGFSLSTNFPEMHFKFLKTNY